MAKAGYAFSGIELTDPYTADADYWDCCARAACLAMIEGWEGMSQLAENDSASIREMAALILPLTEKTDDKA